MIYMSGKTKSLFLTAIWIVAAFASTVSAEHNASGAVKGPCPNHSALCTKPQTRIEPAMYIAMNRFTVARENAKAFEDVWLGRDSHLKGLNGFVEFHMLKGPETDGMILYSSHTVWEDENAFTAWTKSEAFRAAHKDAGENRKLHEGHPVFEGFTSIQSIS